METILSMLADQHVATGTSVGIPLTKGRSRAGACATTTSQLRLAY